MKRRTRLVLFGLSVTILAFALLPTLLAMKPAGQHQSEYADWVTLSALRDRNATNSVQGVLFDHRSGDAIGELFAVLAAAAGVQLLLRTLREEDEGHPRDARSSLESQPTSEQVTLMAMFLIPAVLLYGLYTTLRGHVTIGGGFQGGALLASAIALLYLAGRYRTMRWAVFEERLDRLETLGATGFVITGAIGLVATGAFLGNFLPLGEAGRLASAGVIGFYSVLVAIEAAAALTLMVNEMQEQTLLVRHDA